MPNQRSRTWFTTSRSVRILFRPLLLFMDISQTDSVILSFCFPTTASIHTSPVSSLSYSLSHGFPQCFSISLCLYTASTSSHRTSDPFTSDLPNIPPSTVPPTVPPGATSLKRSVSGGNMSSRRRRPSHSRVRAQSDWLIKRQQTCEQALLSFLQVCALCT